MTKVMTSVLIATLIAISVVGVGDTADMSNAKVFSKYVLPGPDEVQLAFSGVEIPLGRMLLVRKDAEYCAVKFTRFWTEKGAKEQYATYEVYYQKDGSGNFLNKNVKFSQGKASTLPPRGPFYPLKWQPGKPEVKCGSLKLLWGYKGFVCFFERGNSPGEHGIELAPTPWTSVKEVNVFDPRVKWYRYDEKRERGSIPVDKLWEDK